MGHPVLSPGARRQVSFIPNLLRYWKRTIYSFLHSLTIIPNQMLASKTAEILPVVRTNEVE
jgi:hypothetical protein